MAKTKISEYSSTPSDNTDIDGINIAEGCAPSGINNAIREMMSQLKDQQTGASGDNFTVGGNLVVTGTSSFTGNAVYSGSIQTPSGGGLSPAGSILIWGGAVNSPPTGYLICDGSAVSRETYANLFAAVGTTHGSGNGATTFNLPDLRDKFVVGASGTKAVASTGGSADAIVVSHTHTATSTVTDPGHLHTFTERGDDGIGGAGLKGYGVVGFDTYVGAGSGAMASATTGITVSTTNASTGSSGTGANLPPYYALAYIIRT
jgi:microcystin-dependent protein